MSDTSRVKIPAHVAVLSKIARCVVAILLALPPPQESIAILPLLGGGWRHTTRAIQPGSHPPISARLSFACPTAAPKPPSRPPRAPRGGYDGSASPHRPGEMEVDEPQSDPDTPRAGAPGGSPHDGMFNVFPRRVTAHPPSRHRLDTAPACCARSTRHLSCPRVYKEARCLLEPRVSQTKVVTASPRFLGQPDIFSPHQLRPRISKMNQFMASSQSGWSSLPYPSNQQNESQQRGGSHGPPRPLGRSGTVSQPPFSQVSRLTSVWHQGSGSPTTPRLPPGGGGGGRGFGGGSGGGGGRSPPPPPLRSQEQQQQMAGQEETMAEKLLREFASIPDGSPPSTPTATGTPRSSMTGRSSLSSQSGHPSQTALAQRQTPTLPPPGLNMVGDPYGVGRPGVPRIGGTSGVIEPDFLGGVIKDALKDVLRQSGNR